MRSADIRSRFIRYFESQGHTRVKSSSLIPAADPTLLFTNAGMVQFKDNFLGKVDSGYKRATTSQKCIRAGGKHNDLENVGFTARHHTFFEMLGNFSFGDYFKKEAIAYAWDLLIKEFKFPKDRLRVTVFRDDDEAFNLWKGQGIPADWITRLGEKDNFWAMGDTGPCGPCTEIYFDLGKEFGPDIPDCNPGNDGGTRFLEIWNLVFMQFDRSSDGKLTPLPKPSVDTGGGLERWAAVLQGKFSNYESDLFQPILQTIAKRVGKTYGTRSEDDVSMRVIADHLRSGAFLMSDGVSPSNEGRGYVLRRILRRAIRHGKKLGQETPFLFELLPSVVESLGSEYPELVQQKQLTTTLLKEEETKFHETLHRGMHVMEEAIQAAKKKGSKIFSGEAAFKLYDSYGFPMDLIEVIAKENQLDLDQKDFDERMDHQRSQSTFLKGQGPEPVAKIEAGIGGQANTRFLGYDCTEAEGTITHLFNEEGSAVDKLKGNGFVIADQTPFYAESGGQIGDKGEIVGAAVVHNTFKVGANSAHRVETSKELKKGEKVKFRVNPERRQATAINHTSTHLLHAALRKVLGDRVRQAGSLVDSERLRFDFTYPRGLSPEELAEVESMVNAAADRQETVKVQEMGYDQAIQSGALAFFDEKYGSNVRVVRVGGEEPFSVELCGGTHLTNTGQVQLFKITQESSVASGVRRIEAVTAKRAREFLLDRHHLLQGLEQKLGTKGEQAGDKIEQIQNELKSNKREIEQLQMKLARGGGSGGGSLWDKKIDIKGIQFVREAVNDVKANVLRELVDQVRDKLKQKVVVCLASHSEGKVFLCVGLSSDLVSKWSASEMVKEIASEVGGSGGGRNDFAQAGGTIIDGIPKAFEKLERWIIGHAG